MTAAGVADAQEHALLSRLTSGWTQDQSSRVQDFVRLWSGRLGAKAVFKPANVGPNHAYFTAEHPNIHLHGMGDVPYMLVTGDALGIEEAVRRFWRRHADPRYLPFYLTLSDSAYRVCRSTMREQGGLVFTHQEVTALLADAVPIHQVKRKLRAEIPLLRLLPFDITMPARGNMFFGRRVELKRLLQSGSASFAIAGPGRAGKTSLVREYERTVRREMPERADRLFYVDFQKGLPDHSEYSIALHFGQTLNPGLNAQRHLAGGLTRFLADQRREMGGPLDLILDEVDEVCFSQAFQQIVEAALMGNCRLILCGKENLLRLVQDPRSPAGQRLLLIRLQPLAYEAAERLLLDPIADLGFHVPEPQRLAQMVCDWTGRQPQLLQHYGRMLIELADAMGTDTISLELFDRIRDEFQAAQEFLAPLLHLDDPEALLLGLTMVQREPQVWSIASVQSIAAEEGFPLEYSRAQRLCNTLIINHVLDWNGAGYIVANAALPYYARKMDLAALREEARSAVTGKQAGGAGTAGGPRR